MLDVLTPIATWLTRKTRTQVDPELLRQAFSRQLPEQSRLESTVLIANDAEYVALRYSHPDRLVNGREWITEIGLRRSASEFSCSTLLRTDERSALVVGNVETTRPIVVEEIARACKLSAECPGGVVRPLTVDDADAFAFLVSDPERNRAIVQLSSLRDGTFVVDSDRLASLLIGVADVVVIPPEVNTFDLEDRLGAQFSCYHGAVNIIWPLARSSTGHFVPNTHVMATELFECRSQGGRVEGFLLAVVCHRTNSAYARRHLSPEAVHSIGLRHALEDAKESGAKSDAEFANLLRQVDHDQQAEIKQLKEDANAKDNEIATLYQELDTARATVDALRQSISAMSQPTILVSGVGLDHQQRAKLVEALSNKFDLEAVLQVMHVLFADRLVILESAWAAARSADEFKYSHKAFALLAIMCGEYWNALSNGKSDLEAKACLGTAYSAKESETVEKNKRARKLRTFMYKGHEVEMMAHLRIGTKPSRHETWRCHFYWDAEDDKIVIGHCGEHLDHK